MKACLPASSKKTILARAYTEINLASWISGISIRCFKVYIHDSPISVLLYLSFKKSVETKHAYEKSTFYCIGMIVFKLEIIKEIFENEKLKLSLNSKR